MYSTKQQAVGRVLVWLADVTIEGFQIEVELAQMLRFETVHLEFYGNQCIEAAMEEEQVECKVPRADLHGIFGTDETEVAAQLDQKLL